MLLPVCLPGYPFDFSCCVEYGNFLFFGWFAVDECSCVWNWLWPGVKICGNEVIRASCVCGLSSGHSQTKFVRCVVVPRTLNWVGFEVVLVAFVR